LVGAGEAADSRAGAREASRRRRRQTPCR